MPSALVSPFSIHLRLSTPNASNASLKVDSRSYGRGFQACIESSGTVQKSMGTSKENLPIKAFSSQKHAITLPPRRPTLRSSSGFSSPVHKLEMFRLSVCSERRRQPCMLAFNSSFGPPPPALPPKNPPLLRPPPTEDLEAKASFVKRSEIDLSWRRLGKTICTLPFPAPATIEILRVVCRARRGKGSGAVRPAPNDPPPVVVVVVILSLSTGMPSLFVNLTLAPDGPDLGSFLRNYCKAAVGVIETEPGNVTESGQ
ncbi:hypothetical protein KC367_g216 [Hortaea werneckii]|nr:hypothetical protein KC367_g216 [Hortaea werneckii]